MKKSYFPQQMAYSLLFTLLILPTSWAKSSTTEGLLAKVAAEIKEAKSKMTLDVKVPDLSPKAWKVHVLAEEETISDSIEVTGGTLLYTGNRLKAERLIVHGDGILLVDGELLCPEIDVKGNGIVIFKKNSVRYYGGQMKVGSGLVIAKSENNLNLRIRKDGAYYCGGENKGEIMIDGLATIEIKGNQEGNIIIGEGKGRPAIVNVKRNLKGKVNSQQSCDIAVEDDIFGHMDIKGNLKLSGRNLIASDITVSETLNAKLNSVISKKDKQNTLKAKQATISTVRNNVSDLHTALNLTLKVGGSHQGKMTSNTGNIDATITENSKGDIAAGNSIKAVASNLFGNITAANNANLTIKDTLESYLLKTGKNATVKAGTFKGNADIGGKGDLSAVDFVKGEFYYQVKMDHGSLKAKKNNELEIAVAKKGSVNVGQNNRANIKIGAQGDVTVGESNTGSIIIGDNGIVKVKREQMDVIYIGGTGDVEAGRAHKSIIVKKEAKIKLGESVDSYYDEGVIQIANGLITTIGKNSFDIQTTSADKNTKVTIGDYNEGNMDIVGTADIAVSRDQTGKTNVGKGGSLKARSHFGNITFGDAANIDITNLLCGNLYVAANKGTTTVNIGTAKDANMGIYGLCNMKTGDISNDKPGEETIFIQTGSLISKNNIESNFVAKGAMHVQARNIYGNVDIGDPNSKVDAIVKGKVTVGK
ncbi:MAG: hypothetical protein HQL32_05490 [Planctomycetes bacterium]|nr:hypothetical protein [Planctomycetota bacterium]